MIHVMIMTPDQPHLGGKMDNSDTHSSSRQDRDSYLVVQQLN